VATYPCGIKLGEVAEAVWAYGQDLQASRGEDIIGDDDGDVRFRVWDYRERVGPPVEWAWEVKTGSPDYDQDHRGHWGTGSVSPGLSKRAAREVARDLIEEALDARAQAA
jgi:hypothetical protein